MTDNKIKIPEAKFDINLKFYFFLKYLLKTKLTDAQICKILSVYSANVLNDFTKIKDKINQYITTDIKNKSSKQQFLFDLMDKITSNLDLKMFIFSMKLYAIKDLLLEEAKINNLLDITKLENLDPLSLEYDNITTFSPYSTRVSGALLSLIFFDKLENNETNFISQKSELFISSLSSFAIDLKNKGVEPNQIFMLMFSESINQSIISDSGSNYEDRILAVLTSIGLNKNEIEKFHDNKSTEFDFFFKLDNVSYGVGAKRTLRERYKQFIKTSQMSKIDVMIEITLGIDLTEEKAKSIRNHNVVLFVADEIYQNTSYLKGINCVYSSKDLTLKTLKSLANNYNHTKVLWDK
jgi:hypothetical protein